MVMPGGRREGAECREFQEWLSPYLDGELAPWERARLEEHLKRCPACRREVARWQEIRRALEGLKATPPAPAGFKQRVLLRVQKGRRLRWLKSLAAVAAVLLLLAGSAAGWGQGFWKRLALDPGMSPFTHTRPQEPAPAAPESPRPEEGPIPEARIREPEKRPPEGDREVPPPSGEEKASAGEQPKENPAPAPAASGKESPTKPQPLQVAAGPLYPERFFLSSDLEVASALIKIKAQDLEDTRKAALRIAGRYGALIKPLGEQNTGRERRVLYQLTLDQSRGEALVGELASLGGEVQRSRTDLTPEFQRLLDQYREKVSRANTALDPGERERLRAEARDLENRLAHMEKQAQNMELVLWIEAE